MNKQEIKQATQVIAYGKIIGVDYIARGLSSLHRSARTNKSKQALEALALEHKATNDKEWIICG